MDECVVCVGWGVRVGGVHVLCFQVWLKIRIMGYGLAMINLQGCGCANQT